MRARVSGGWPRRAHACLQAGNLCCYGRGKGIQGHCGVALCRPTLHHATESRPSVFTVASSEQAAKDRPETAGKSAADKSAADKSTQHQEQQDEAKPKPPQSGPAGSATAVHTVRLTAEAATPQRDVGAFILHLHRTLVASNTKGSSRVGWSDLAPVLHCDGFHLRSELVRSQRTGYASCAADVAGLTVRPPPPLPPAWEVGERVRAGELQLRELVHLLKRSGHVPTRRLRVWERQLSAMEAEAAAGASAATSAATTASVLKLRLLTAYQSARSAAECEAWLLPRAQHATHTVELPFGCPSACGMERRTPRRWHVMLRRPSGRRRSSLRSRGPGCLVRLRRPKQSVERQTAQPWAKRRHTAAMWPCRCPACPRSSPGCAIWTWSREGHSPVRAPFRQRMAQDGQR